ncbi:MAG: hypothetical protein C3F11_03935, partial [Methylocystaceae bacterium]
MEPKVKVTECFVFHSFLRIRVRLSESDARPGEAISSARLIPIGSDSGAGGLKQRLAFDPNHAIVEALVD